MATSLHSKKFEPLPRPIGRRAILLALFGLAFVPLVDCDSKTLLQSLPTEYSHAPWKRFQRESEHSFTAYTKSLAECEEDGAADQPSRPAVIKVLARVRLPVRELLNVFKSQDPKEIAEWNPFAGEVMHLDKAAQLQTYRLPWPFSSREYLVRCEDRTSGKSGHQAHCASIDDHPSAPLRPDRVRGRSETVWRFVEEKDGLTSIQLETLVDPRGSVPTWVVEKLGKQTAVKIVRALIRHTSERYRLIEAKMKEQRASPDYEAPSSVSSFWSWASGASFRSWLSIKV